MTRFKKVRNVNLPIIKVNAGKEAYFTATKPMYKGKKLEGKPGEEDKEPVDLLDVVDLESGEEGTIVVAKVLGEILNDEYPSAGYVDKSFSILKHPKRDGKKYHQYTVCEIEVETTEEPDEDE